MTDADNAEEWEMRGYRLGDRRGLMNEEQGTTVAATQLPDDWEGELLVAGEQVSSGRYRRVDIPCGIVVEVAAGERLPASFDGHVAVDERQRPPVQHAQHANGFKNRAA